MKYLMIIISCYFLTGCGAKPFPYTNPDIQGQHCEYVLIGNGIASNRTLEKYRYAKDSKRLSYKKLKKNDKNELINKSIEHVNHIYKNCNGFDKSRVSPWSETKMELKLPQNYFTRDITIINMIYKINCGPVTSPMQNDNQQIQLWFNSSNDLIYFDVDGETTYSKKVNERCARVIEYYKTRPTPTFIQ